MIKTGLIFAKIYCRNKSCTFCGPQHHMLQYLSAQFRNNVNKTSFVTADKQ